MILMPQIFDVTANENARYKRNELEWNVLRLPVGPNDFLSENPINPTVFRNSVYTYHHETSHADSPWGKDVPYTFWGQKVKGQGRNGDFDILKNSPRGGYLSR